MSSKWGILVILLTVGCQGPKGDPGPVGPAGSTGGNGSPGNNGMTGMTPDGGVAPVAVNCAPATSFCDANRVWTCTRSGADAVLTQDCATVAGTTNNPTTCATTNCPYYSTAGGCCRPSKPTCTWNLGGTTTMSGSVYGGYGANAGVYCTAPVAPPASCNVGNFSVLAYQPHANLCPPGNDMLRLDIDRAKVTPGQTVTLSTASNGVTLYEYVGNSVCTQWNGTVTWDADVPHWKVTFNATCTTTNVTMTLTGTMSGEI